MLTEELLLLGFGSEPFPVTFAVLFTVPSRRGSTLIVTVALAPTAKEPSEHVTVPAD